MDQQKYKVEIAEFAERHFIKKFEKKYKTQWEKTKETLIFECEHIQNMLLSQRADLITTSEGCQLVKLDFAVFGTKISPKKSGNRCILAVDNNLHIVKIMLVYAKTDLPPRNETQEWKKLIKVNFPKTGEKFNL